MRKKIGKDISVLILAASPGKRSKTHGSKSLLDVDNHTHLINSQIHTVRNVFPKSEIISVLGFQAEKIIKHLAYETKIVENESYDIYGILRSISLGLRVCSHNNIIIIYGDLLFNENAIDRIVYGGTTAVVDSSNQLTYDNIGVMTNNEYITRFCYGPQVKWGQIIYFTGEESINFKHKIYSKEKKKYHTTEILNTMIDEGSQIRFMEPENMKILEIEYNSARKLND